MPDNDYRQHSVQCISARGLHRLAWYEWGDPANPHAVLCAHGLTRCGRDFEPLALALASRYRVICQDFPGRGASDRLVDPTEYQVPVYVADIVTLIARLNVQVLDWVGTSMGGLIGMTLASLPAQPLRRLVINDVGAVLQAGALQRIGSYVGKNPRFDTLDQAVAYLRAIHAPFGQHSDAQWRFLTEISLRTLPDGGFQLHYDPAIANAFAGDAVAHDVDLWAIYDRLHLPVLLTRGAESDLLPRAIAEQMTTRGPCARLVEFAGVGHAPTFFQDDQIRAVSEFLSAC